jgi:polyisoprenoid-binding protein YceI
MALRIRRGTEAQRISPPFFEAGEIVWTTDAQQLWVGDGVTQGGINILASSAGSGLVWNGTTKRLQISGVTTDDVAEGSNRLYHTTERTVDAVGAALVAGNNTNVGITFTYSQTQDDAGRINATVALDGVGITDVVNDVSPSLGGDLDLNEYDITGFGNIDITGDVTITGMFDNGTITLDGDTITTTNPGPVGGVELVIGTAGTATSVKVLTNNAYVTSQKLQGLSAGSQAATTLEFATSRGSISVPQPLQVGDGTGFIQGRAWDGANYQLTTIIGSFIDPNGTVGAGIMSGSLVLGMFSDTDPTHAKTVSFNRKGWVTVGRTIFDDAKAHVDINGVMLLAPQNAAPANLFEGMIAVANRTGWDPCSVGSGLSYPVYYNGSVWLKLTP